MKNLVIHVAHLRSLFSLIECWLISSWVISLTPLDLLNLSLPNPSRSSSFELLSAQSQGEPESPAQGPETPDYPDTPALRPDTPDIWNLLYTVGRVGVNGSLQSFYHSRRPLFSLLFHSRPRGDFYLPAITNSSIFEGRLSSPPETPGRPWIWSSRAHNGLKGTFELRIARSPNVVGFFERSLGHLFLACVGTFGSSFMQIPWPNL